MARVYNFSAGPSQLPESVLKTAAKEMLEYSSSGQSVMEMSHRSRVFGGIIGHCEELLRRLMNIPDGYKVLFLQGGGATQFAMVPLNLMTGSGEADFVLTGEWSTKAYKEAARYGKASVVASSEDQKFSYIPQIDPARLNPRADYFNICYNNTLYGTAFQSIPEVGVPLVADISSCILSRPLDVSRFGLLYAGAQKNLGPAGVTIVIMREELIGHAMELTPTMLNYKTHAEKDSLYNTPPCYAIYMVGLVLEWLENEIGGVAEMEKINAEKSSLLYNYLDESRLFRGTARADSRSLCNVTFVTGDPDMDKEFVAEAEKEGMVNLKGHRLVGGIRASIYNAMPKAGVVKLVDFMNRFEKTHSAD